MGISFDGLIFEKYFGECLFESAIPEKGALALLEYLRGKYILCAASNGPYLQQVNRLKTGGMLLLSLAASVYQTSDLGIAPYDAVSIILAEKCLFHILCVEFLPIQYALLLYRKNYAVWSSRK